MANKKKLKQADIVAIEALKRKIKNAQSQGNFKEAADYYNQLGNQYRHVGKFEEAIDAHQEEINISKRHNHKDKMAIGIAYRNMGEVLLEMGSPIDALKQIRLYLSYAIKEGNSLEQQRAYITLGRAYLTMSEKQEETDSSENLDDGSTEKAFQSFRKAYDLLSEDDLIAQVKEKELMLMKCSNCQNLGLTLEIQGKFPEATKWLMKAVEIGSHHKFHENLAPCYTMLCSLYLRDGKHKEALKAAKNATITAKALGDQALEAESHILESKALFLDDEVDAGKKILKKLRQRIKKKHNLQSYLEELDTLLTAAVRVSRTLDFLVTPTDEDPENRMRSYEVLGDNYSTLMNFGVAIKYYKKACQYAEMLGINGKKLARLYFSVAESYKDMENYNEALKYFRKEMSMHSNNPVEAFKTQTNITMVLEKMKEPENIVCEAHEKAIALAQESKNVMREITALKNYSLYLKSIGQTDNADRKKELANEIKSKNEITEMDENEPDSQDLLNEDDFIDLDALSEEEDSDDETEDGKKKRVNIRVNEAGESQLHVVAKRGDLKGVRRLIRQGHTVKVRDNAGWTPLHEACNFGHFTVVEELLKHGADVNDAGGALAEKITPLHDAAGNGHCEVMKVLIKYGANVLARDSEGRYPIDSLLAWRESDAGNNCSELELVAYREVKELLKGQMAKAGKPYRPEDEKRSRRKARTKRSQSPEHSVLLATKKYEEDCPVLAKTVVDDYDPDKEGDGEELYRNAIKQVGRKSLEKRGNRKEKARPISPGPRGALIPSEKDFHQKHDDWLLPDDEEIPSTSKKHSTGKPKRKRDPMEDVALGERSTRRKTGSSGRGRDRDEEVSATSREHDSEEELMDIESQNYCYEPTPAQHISPPSDHTPRNPTDDIPVQERILNDSFEDEDLSQLLNDDFGLGISSHVNETFLPSQRPTVSTVEFGRTIDVPVAENSNDDEDDEGNPAVRVRGSRTKKSSPTKRLRAITVSSDEDDFQTNSRIKNRMKYSDISNVLKQANSSMNQRKEKHLVQTRLLPIKIIPKHHRKSDSDSDSSSITSPPSENISGTSRRRTFSSSNLPNTGHNADEWQKKEVLRLKIRILDKVLLVPVDDTHINESIDWLAKESAERYLRMYGVKPILSLQTKDGATLSGADPISLVLEANERELDGIVTNFDLPPLTERYGTACSEAGIKVDPDIKTSLNNCQSSNILNLFDENLRGKSATVLMSALQRQNSLRILVLSGCSLFDNGLLELCKVLPTLSGLTEIDLSSNGITRIGFTAFVDVFLKETQSNAPLISASSVPVGLTSLVLSHNPLGNQIGTTLASLLNKLSALRRLELSDCDFSEKLFILSKMELTRALNDSRLEEVDISYNSLDVGLEKCLQSLPARRIRTLNCSSCASTNNNDVLAKAVGTFLSGNEDCCNLATLKLNDCGLNDKSMDLIIDNFDRLVRLENLELACNDSLTVLSLVNVLERSVEREIPLTSLDFGSIPNMWNTSRVSNEQILLALTKKLSSQKKLSTLRVPVSGEQYEEVMQTESESQFPLSNLERKISELWSEYAGSANFHFEKQGACLIYSYED